MPEPLTLLAFNHFTRRARNLEASRKFYVDVLGCEVISRPAFDFAGYWLYVAGVQVHLIEDLNLSDAPQDVNTRTNHVAFVTDDIEAIAQRLREHGIAYARRTIPDRDILQIFFHDPDGWMIEVGFGYGTIDR